MNNLRKWVSALSSALCAAVFLGSPSGVVEASGATLYAGDNTVGYAHPPRGVTPGYIYRWYARDANAWFNAGSTIESNWTISYERVGGDTMVGVEQVSTRPIRDVMSASKTGQTVDFGQGFDSKRVRSEIPGGGDG